MTRQAANILSGLRVVLAPVLAGCICAGGAAAWRLALMVFALAAAADVADGWVARRVGAASSFGRWLDHAADIVFLLSGFGAFAWVGAIGWWVPLSIAAAFAVYVADSLRRADGLVGSRVGHLGGVLNYVLLGAVLVLTERRWAAPAGPLPLTALLWVVPLYSGAAIAERLRPRRSAASAGGRIGA